MPTTIRPMSSSAFVRCQSSRRNRQIQASSEGDDEDRQEEPAAEPGDVGLRVAQAELVDRLEVARR